MTPMEREILELERITRRLRLHAILGEGGLLAVVVACYVPLVWYVWTHSSFALYWLYTVSAPFWTGVLVTRGLIRFGRPETKTEAVIWFGSWFFFLILSALWLMRMHDLFQ
jgi:hypothetical protein